MRGLRNSLLLVALVLLGFTSMGCLGVYTPAQGLIWTDASGPIDAGDKVGAKEGRACAQSILGVFATGDASIRAAAAAGNITKIDSVDHYTKWTVIAGEFCTVVRGS